MNTITQGKTKLAMEHLTWTELSQRKAKVGKPCAYPFITFFSSTVRKKKSARISSCIHETKERALQSVVVPKT